jgi:hypothetical protein
VREEESPEGRLQGFGSSLHGYIQLPVSFDLCEKAEDIADDGEPSYTIAQRMLCLQEYSHVAMT